MEKNVENKPVAVVLGGTFPHIELVKNLQKRGYFVVLIDYYENPPAKNFADKHLQESTLDKEKVLNIARNINAKLVISTCIDQANVTACYVGEKLKLHVPYSYKTALSVTNKILMKKKMVENGIPTSKFVFVKDIHSLNMDKLCFPLIVKPTDSNSSKGVRKACNEKELLVYLEEAIDISRNGEAIIEEYKVGKEIGVDCFVKNNKANVLMVKERRKMLVNEDDNPVQQIYGCIWPADISEKNISKLKQIADKIAQAFNLDNTPLMIQTIVKGDEINVIEFAPRIGGGESFRIIKLSTDFDFVDAAVESFLGMPVYVNCKRPNTYYAENFIYSRKGTFDYITGHEVLLKNGIIEYLDSYKNKGVEIGSDMSSNNRIGVFAVKSDDKNELFNKINIALENIEVFDVDGNSIMRKDIYCSE